MSRRAIFVICAAVVAAACGSTADSPTTAPPDDPQATTTSTTAPVTTTTDASTTTEASTTTTLQPSTTTTTTGDGYVVGTPTFAPPQPLEGSDGASGSGCVTGGSFTDDQRPDGIWYGFVLDRTEDGVVFDLACFWFGDIAWEKAEEAGDEAPNDFWITNDSDQLRRVPVDAATTLHVIDFGAENLGFVAVPFGEWPEGHPGWSPCPGDLCGMWLYINDGAVTEIVEQYIP